MIAPEPDLSRIARRILLVSLLAALAACGGRSEPGDVEPSADVDFDRASPAMLTIENSHWLDVVVFVFHDGEMSRVGEVTAASSGNFTLPAWMLGQARNIRLLADPVGSDQWIRTETIHVQPGQSVEWRLESQLARSQVMVY